jgi:hypothetical protein
MELNLRVQRNETLPVLHYGQLIICSTQGEVPPLSAASGRAA